MGVNTVHALGRTSEVWAVKETPTAALPIGSYAAPVANDAFKFLSASVTAKQPRKPRDDHRGSRSLAERISQRASVEWDLVSKMIPHGSAGSKPDIEVLLANLFGVQTVNGGTSVVYTFSNVQTALGSMTMLFVENEGRWSDLVLGAVGEQLKVKVPGTAEPTLEFSGFGRKHVHTGRSTIASFNIVGGAPNFLTPNEVNNYEVDSLIELVNAEPLKPLIPTAKNASTGELTFNQDITVAAVNDEMIPWRPGAPVYTGAVLDGLSGTFTIGGTAVPFHGFEATIANGHKQVGDEVFTTFISDYIPGHRRVSGVCNLRLRRDLQKWWARRKDFVTTALVCEVGSAVGKRWKFNFPKAEFDFETAIAYPEADELVVALPFVALASTDTAADELDLTIY